MYEIIRVGVPIKKQDIQKEFLDILEEIKRSKDCISVSTTYYDRSEYDLAPAGTEVLLNSLPVVDFFDKFQYNCINTIGFIWKLKNNDGETRDLKQIITYLNKFLDDQHKLLNFKKVYMFTPGSPNYSDSITLELRKIRDISIVNTKSSIEYAIEEMKKVVGNVEFEYRNYHTDFLERFKKQNNKIIHINKLNVFCCLQGGYKIDNRSIMELFFDDMSNYFNKDDIFISVHIGDPENIVIVSDFYNARLNMKDIENYPHMLTFGIIRNSNDNSRAISQTIPT